MNGDTSATGTTLFAVLRDPHNSREWNRFVERYGPRVFAWCRARGLQTADAEDATQEVLQRFARIAPSFRYDHSQAGFRAWLRTVTRNVLSDLARDWQRRQAGGNAVASARLELLAGADDLDRELGAELHRELLEQAMNLVRLRVEPQTWAAFELLALQGKSGKEAAAELQLSIASAYMARSRVNRLLTEEVRKLEESL